jgi:hypothetical protein
VVTKSHVMKEYSWEYCLRSHINSIGVMKCRCFCGDHCYEVERAVRSVVEEVLL